MATYTALIGDTSSIGVAAADNDPLGGGKRRNPAVAVARIRNIVAPHIISSSLGGLLTCDFTIPAQEAQLWRPLLRYGAVVWLFDGASPIFYGWAEQPTWAEDGSVLMNVSGAWVVLGRSQMREAWEVWDMSLLNPGTAPAESNGAQVNLGNDGTLRLAFTRGTAINGTDRVSVEYLLFGEASGPEDTKQITAFELDVVDNAFHTSANLRFRVIGCTAPGVNGDILFDTNVTGASAKQGALNLAGSNQGAAAWPSTTGYRCLRFQLVATAAVSGGALGTSYVTLDRVRIGTREALFTASIGTLDTGAVARDVLTIKGPSGAGSAVRDLPQEFWPSRAGNASPDSNTDVYSWGLDPRIGTGSAPNSGIQISGFSSLEWQDPATILTALAAIDQYHVGFYLPYNGRGGYDSPGSQGGGDVGSFWLSAPPQLYYQAFPDPNYAPDYTIHTRDGAQVAPNAQTQMLLDAAYVNYQNIRGRQLSAVTEDTNTLNYLYAQGFRRAEDYSVQPSLGDASGAVAIGQQMMATRRQPYTSASITITADAASRYPIRKAGAAVPKLALVRPGSMRIADMPGTAGLRAGYATQVEWWGQALGSPEKLQITLGPPGHASKERAIGHLANRLHRERRRVL